MRPLIEIQNLSSAFALDRVNMTIYPGEIYGIIGQSGAGKSTLLRTIGGLSSPSQGHIFFNGIDLLSISTQQLRRVRRNMGMVFQQFNLFSSRTVEENIAYPLEIISEDPSIIKEKVKNLVHLVGLEKKKGEYPSQLSGGEKQRVGIARALATDPQLLLCDEATSALDPKTAHDILSLLKKIHRQLGITILFVTHQMEVIRELCIHVAVMEKGQIVEQGEVCQLFSHPKHPSTRYFLEKSVHDLPADLIGKASPRRKLVRMKFRGDLAKEPIISQMIRQCSVDANILLGWIDRFSTSHLGTLVVELLGSPPELDAALHYLKIKNVDYEIIEHVDG